ncbi:type I secretion system permease/ATPase [Candidatus Gracilibacteria bacterium]|nr:type I secretion system permease/ATPase [Candidatus Gracilibacteria bacterium]NJM89637.1 type I secretion system permease/ATPase [Hydrococcus sp. RU_2_2]NJP18608.1 type I secretion system permease/ATPase [Hydrococcus sp. CRU_1_1]
MNYTATEFQEFIASVAPFDKLPDEVLIDLAQKIEPWRYRMGQIVLMQKKMLPHVAILYEGKARLLSYDPRTQMPVTLKLLESGSILGWVNLVRGVACETVISSTEAICLTLKNSDFTRLIEEYPQFGEAFRGKAAILEVFELLGYQLAQQAQGEVNLKELTTKMMSDVEVRYLAPGKLSSTDLTSLQASRRIWLASGANIANCEIGARLDLSSPQTIEVIGNSQARLLGFTEERLNSNLQLTIEPTSSVSTPVESTLESLPDTQPTAIPYAEAELLEEERKVEVQSAEVTTEKKYPHVSGKTPLEAGVACFQMLSQYFGMPFRKEVIRRIVSDQLVRSDNLSLPLCGAIAELMGLNAQLVKIPAKSFTNLNAPVLVRWQDSLAILYEISDRYMVIGVPEIGILRRQSADFLESWGVEGEVLLLQKTKETPQERFGLRWFLPALTRYRRVLIEVFVASFFVQLFGLANPLMVQVIIDKVIVQNSVDTLQVLGIFLVVIAIFEAVLTTLRTYLFVDTTNRIDMSLGSEIIDHLLRLPLRYFERRPVGEISTRVNELENIRQFLTGTALTVVLDAVFSVVYIIAMVIYSPILTAVALGIVPVFVALTIFFSPIIRRQLRVKAERNAQTQSYLVEVMTGIQTVKAQNIELRSRWQWQEKYANYVSAGFQTVITSTFASSMSNFLNKLSGLLVLWVGAYLVLQQELTLGQLIAFRIIASYVTSPILRLAQIWQNFQETALSLERLADIVDSPQEAEQDRQNIPMPLIKGAVKYENISFRFKSHGPLQLYNVNLEFQPGTFVAIVGQSGAGKSTVTKLVSRLYEPESGRILIDGYDINKVELYSLRRQIGVVPQDTLLFDGTVQDNIALTNPDATTEDVIEAAKVAAAHEFIMQLPNGYNTRVGERGSALSGGQRQRIAIARTVMQQPRILVLDEATSALDYATEQQLCINLIDAFHDRTVFFITHRLGSIKNSDVIVMMDAGSVVEQGSHEELMALKGRYYYLYNQQEKS